MHLVDQPNSTFTTPELARLAAYRAAVEAGFYSDWDGSASSTDVDVLAWLSRAHSADGEEAYPFTTEEHLRLDRLRASVAEGGYADDQPQAPATPTSDDTAR